MQRRITKDLLIYLPGQALPALAAFITVPIYTRLFPPSEYGNYILATAVTEFLILATITGFGQAAVRFFSSYQLKAGLPGYFAVLFSSIGAIVFCVTIIAAGILILIRPWISSELYPLLWAAIGLFIATAFYSTLMDILRGEEKSSWYTTFSICSAYAGIIFGLIFVLVFKMDISGLIWGQALGYLLPVIPLIWLTTRSIKISTKSVNRSDYKQVWSFALPFTIGNTAHWTLNFSDRYFVEAFRSSFEVGLYSVANKISWRTIQLLVYLFYLVPAPIISRTWEERGREASEEALTTFTRMFFLIIIPAVVGLSVIAAPLMRLLADEAYYGGYPAIWLVACGSMALGLADLGSTGCMLTKRTKLIARNQVIAACANLIINLLLIPVIGFMGAAISTMLSFIFLALLQSFTSSRYLTWRWPLRSLGRVLVASAMMAGGVILIQMNIRSDTTLWLATNLIVSIVFGALIYGLALIALGEFPKHQLPGYFRPKHKGGATQS
jgi:O-antigen/teichoic acid export membrane protein